MLQLSYCLDSSRTGVPSTSMTMCWYLGREQSYHSHSSLRKTTCPMVESGVSRSVISCIEAPDPGLLVECSTVECSTTDPMVVDS